MPPSERAITVVGRTAALTVLALLFGILRYLAIPVLLPIAVVQRLRHGPSTRRPHEFPAPRVPADLDQTAPPELHADGTAACSGCDAVVPFASMSICEDGYFCPGCARAA